jgi:membrane protein implicated in regulation of membrane protease activity
MAINYTYPAKSTPTTSDKVLIIDNEDTTNPQSTKTATIQSIVSLATGSGDVTGPASSIDNSIAVYDGTTGKVIKNDTGVIIDADSNVVLENWPESEGEFRGDVDGGIRFAAQADGALSKGDVVYISGASGANTLVAKAQANSSSTMPAFGFANRAALSGATVQIITFGNIYGSGTYPLDTTTDSEGNPLTIGDEIYVSSTIAGGYTNVKPSSEANLIQNIGKIVRVNANNGVIKVGGAGRANATPNLDSAKIFVGNASNYSASVAMSGDVTIDNAGVTTVDATITNGAAAGAVALPLAGGEMSGTIAGNQDIIGKRPTIVDTNAILTLQDNVHEGAFLYSNAATATTITIDPFSSEPFAEGTEIKIMRGATPPSVTVTPGSGVSLNGGTGGIAIAAAYGTITLKQLSVDVWVAYV